MVSLGLAILFEFLPMKCKQKSEWVFGKDFPLLIKKDKFSRHAP